MNEKVRYFFPKVLNRIAHEKNRIWKYLPVEKIFLWGMRPIPPKDEFFERLRKMLGIPSIPFSTPLSTLERDSILTWANHTLNHDFDYLGSGLKHLDPIAWHSDLKTGYTWPKGTFYRDFASYPEGSDIKCPWELSRGHHLLWLGEAYQLTGEAKYAQEVMAEIDDWIDDNSLMYSVNWTCSMDVAIRVVNWMYALNFISEYEGVTEVFVEKVYKSFAQHTFFIKNNLEKVIPYNNNHYSTDIVGLVYLSIFLKKKRLRRFAIKEFFNDILIQVLESGVHYERSISYHRLMVELYGYSICMLHRLGETAPKYVMARVQKMHDYVSNYTKGNGYAPQISDNDDGRFLPFVKRDFRYHNYLNDKNSVETRMASAGQEILFYSDYKGSLVYQDAGMAIVNKGDAYLFVSNGGYSKITKESDTSIGTHTHNDLLSFELSAGDKDFIIDPGAYVYTSERAAHNEFRSTKKHNTVVVDDEEQNFLPEKNMFNVKRNVRIGKLEERDNSIIGSYKTIKGDLSHQRSFILENKRLVIKDKLHKAGVGHKAQLRFHLAEGVELSKDITISSESGDVKLIKDAWSPSFGVLRESKTVVIDFKFDDKTETVTTISWI